MGYDSNVFLKPSNKQDSPILRLSPHLYLSTLGAERRGTGEGEKRTPPALAFRGGLSGGYYHYFDTTNPDNISASLDLNLHINPERPFSVVLDGIYTRTITPFVEYFGLKHLLRPRRYRRGPEGDFCEPERHSSSWSGL